MILRASDFAFDLPIRAETWHAIASVVEDLPRMVRRWNLRRRTLADLRGLTAAQRSDLGLDGVDFEKVADRFVR
jgi:uncharacterized protein YjiS (DUF1127 family)